MTKKHYDFVFSLGQACACSQALRDNGLQHASYPLDWVCGADFLARVQLLVNRFDGYMEKENLFFTNQKTAHPTRPCDIYSNQTNHIVFNHDFPAGQALDQYFPLVQAQYRRRINRLYQQIKQANTVLVVYMEVHFGPQHMEPDRNLLKGVAQLRACFADQEIEVLYLSNNPNMTPGEIVRTEPAPYLHKVEANYSCRDKGHPFIPPDQPTLDKILKPYRPLFAYTRGKIMQRVYRWFPAAKRPKVRGTV